MGSDKKEYVLITEYFYPDTATTGQLMTSLAVGLQERGLDISVLTGQPNYHSGDNRQQPKETTHHGVPVKRIGAPQLRQSSLFRRLFNWIIFTLWVTVVLLFSRSKKQREIIFVSNPPFLPIAMKFVCWIRHWEYSYIVHDLYPEQPVELGYIAEGGVIERMWSYLHRLTIIDSRHTIVLGEYMKEYVVEKYGPATEPKLTVIHNWEDGEYIRPIPNDENWFRDEMELTDTFSILYAGNIGEFHDLETLIQSADYLRESAVTYVIIGEGDNKNNIISLAEDLNLGDSVKFLPYQSDQDLPYCLTSCDVSVVTIKEGFEEIGVSSKLYSSLAAGTPVLVIAQPYSDEARLVVENNAGKSVPQGEPEQVAEAIKHWQQNPDLVAEQGTNARDLFEDRFTKEKSINNYYSVLTGGKTGKKQT